MENSDLKDLRDLVGRQFTRRPRPVIMNSATDGKAPSQAMSQNDTKAIILSIACFATYFFYGACYSSLGSALPALATKLGVSTSSFGIAFSTRGIGFLTGTILSAYLSRIPKFPCSKPFLAAIFLLINALMLFVIASATNFALVVILFSIQGVGFGGIDMLLNCAIPEIWGPARAQPWLQATYTCFGVGAIIGPLLVGFIGFQTSFYVFAICCFVPTVMLFCNHFYKQPAVVIDIITGETATKEVITPLHYNDLVLSDANKIDPNFTHTLIGTIARGNNFETLVHRKPSRNRLANELHPHHKHKHKHNYSHVSNVRIPHKTHVHTHKGHPQSSPLDGTSTQDASFQDSASISDVSSVSFSDTSSNVDHKKHVNHFRHHYNHKSHGAVPHADLDAVDIEANIASPTDTDVHDGTVAAIPADGPAPTAAAVDDHKEVTSVDGGEAAHRPVVKANKPLPRHIMMIIMCFYYLISPLYGYGGWVPTYAIQTGVTSSQSAAAFLPAIFWAAMAAGRFTAIFLAMHFTATRMLRIKLLLLAVFSSTLLAVGSSSYINLCVVTFLLGYAISSIYPLAITVVGDYGFIADEHSTLFFIASANIGDCTLPVTIGLLMTGVGPESLVVAVFICSFTMIGLYLTMNYLSRKLQKANLEADLLAAGLLIDGPTVAATAGGDLELTEQDHAKTSAVTSADASPLPTISENSAVVSELGVDDRV